MKPSRLRQIAHAFLKVRLHEQFGDAHGAATKKARFLGVARQHIDAVEKGGGMYSWTNISAYAESMGWKSSKLYHELAVFADNVEGLCLEKEE